MKSRSPSKISQCYLPEDKLKIIIRIRPILNEEDDDEFVKLEDVNHNLFRIIRFRLDDLETIPIWNLIISFLWIHLKMMFSSLWKIQLSNFLMVLILLFSPMDRQEQAKLIRWLGTTLLMIVRKIYQIFWQASKEEFFQDHCKKLWLPFVKQKIKWKFMSLSFKFTTIKFMTFTWTI